MDGNDTYGLVVNPEPQPFEQANNTKVPSGLAQR
jgi:hypothetical protein